MQRLVRVALAVALAATLRTPPTHAAVRGLRAASATATTTNATTTNATTTTIAPDDLAGTTAVTGVGAGCDSVEPYPEPMTTTTYHVRSEGSFSVLHFSHFNLPPNDRVTIYASGRASNASRGSGNGSGNGNGGASPAESYTYRGDEVHTGFFAATLRSSEVTIELVTKERAEPSSPSLCKGFKVDRVHDSASPANLGGSKVEEVCGADNTREAACFLTDPDKRKAIGAVIRLLIHKDTGSFFCTGWLLGCEGHVVTNNHCISTQAHASSTEFEFDARRDDCDASCATPLGCAGTVVARSSTLITTSADLDYTLVKLDINWSSKYGYLSLRESGARLGDEIYIPQHPSGWGMRVAAKDDSGGLGTVSSLTMGGCAVDQVAYNLDTRAGSSGSPVISTTDNAVIALHHCGGCPNTAINGYKIVNDLRAKNLLPRCGVYQPPTAAPVPSPPPTPAPTPAPTAAPAPAMTVQARVDGTIFATGSTTSVDYVDFTLSADGDVELDMLSVEEVAGADGASSYVDVNGDCNAAYLDSKIILFRLNGDSIAQRDVVAQNRDAPTGYGLGDGSVSALDAYMYLPLTKGSYRLAVGTAAMSKADAVAKINGAARLPRVCSAKVSNYGNYRLTVSASVGVQVRSPGSYIGSQCAAPNAVQPYARCAYHKESALSVAATVEGTIVRAAAAVSVDHIPFTVPAFGRVSVEVSSYESQDGVTFLDINGHCKSAYIDPVAYLFRANAGGLKYTDLINAGDDDDNFALRAGRHSISFRDPFFSLALPPGDYVLAVGRYPLSVDDAIARAGRSSVDKFTPESCGAPATEGHYLVTFGSSRALPLASPGSFTGSHCTPSDRSNPQSICPAV